MNSEVEDCLIRLENQMYGFGGVAGRSASGDRYAVEEHIRDIEGYERDARRDVGQKDARIAELTAEVARYKADAERYRFLRDHADPDNEDPYITILVTNSWGTMAHTVEEGIEADQSIDSAMGERNER